ncbi:hypothetical protein MA20_45485 [Bradyrhizobium japonicum]|uniref:Uncharacterized protein n=1 Tax=Bradyrhizobium japonicum TaxID=375 RepID=A0A0A3XG14_BRAJP|nr:hypothetical protein MA20_45485 [Bradyrhizobium japonicum]
MSLPLSNVIRLSAGRPHAAHPTQLARIGVVAIEVALSVEFEHAHIMPPLPQVAKKRMRFEFCLIHKRALQFSGMLF